MNKCYFGDRLDVMRNHIDDNSVDMIISSPPYNVSKTYTNNSDDLSYDDYLKFLNDTWIECKRVLKVGGRIAINVATISIDKKFVPLNAIIINQLLEIGFLMRGDIIWYKRRMFKLTSWGSFMMPSNPYLGQPYEYILVFSKDDMKHYGDKSNIDITKDEFVKYSRAVWDINPEVGDVRKNHPAPFPEELVYKLLKFYTYKHDLILDPFGGSGTVPVVCIKTDRNYIYIDNSEVYHNNANNRINEVKNNLQCLLF